MSFLGYILSYRHPIAFVCFHFVFGCITLYICGFKLCLTNKSVTPPYTRRVFLYFLYTVCSHFLGNTNLGVERKKEKKPALRQNLFLWNSESLSQDFPLVYLGFSNILSCPLSLWALLPTPPQFSISPKFHQSPLVCGENYEQVHIKRLSV